MAGSKKTERNRQQKQNRAAGIGDETGRIPVRVKEAGTMLTCVECKTELKIARKIKFGTVFILDFIDSAGSFSSINCLPASIDEFFIRMWIAVFPRLSRIVGSAPKANKTLTVLTISSGIILDIRLVLETASIAENSGVLPSISGEFTFLMSS